MNRAIFFLFSLIFFACTSDSSQYEIEGSAMGFDNGTEILVYKLEDNRPIIIDTLTINNEKFTASYPKSDESSLHYLRVGQLNSNIVFFPENEDMKVTLYKDSIQASYVTGGLQNKAYQDYVKGLKEFNKQRQSLTQRFQQARREQDNLLASQIQQENVDLVAEEVQFKKQFLAENNNSVFSIMLAQEMLGKQEITSTEAKEFIDNLTPKMATSQQAKNLESTMESMKKAEIGGVAPNFSAKTPDGEMLSLKETLGKYTIIDFWASWCRPCRIENPNVVKVYNKYHDKGLNIISVSLDKQGQEDRWKKAIEDDNMDWYHVSNLMFWQDPIARMYNVRSIPATFLLDENGNIIDKNLRGAALEAKIASLLGPDAN